ncbi:hypothetical protein ACH4TQ_27490 [Streptomyces sp. NPDC021218]|uniref:hypothetical protein n=1 Tax=Streptomyces sp. NPDC021218 TaxID=3365119 RepID=UPI0037A62DD5
MRIRTTAAAVITAGLLLTGCSSSDDGNDKPSKPTATTAAPTKTPLSKAESARHCITALVDQAAEAPSGEVGTVRPKACTQMDDSEYADAVLDATQQANQAGRDQLQDEIDKATGGAG